MKHPSIRARALRIALATAAALSSLPVFVSTSQATVVYSTTSVAVADAHVSESKPDTNYGLSQKLSVKGSPLIATFVLFDVRGIAGTVESATLQTLVEGGSSKGYDVRSVANTGWDERTLTFANAPAVSSTVTGSSGALSGGTWAGVDVTSLVAGNGRVSLVMTTPRQGTISLASRETGDTAPRLFVRWADTTPPTAPTDVTAAARSTGKIDVSWSASNDNVGVTGYTVLRNGAPLATVDEKTTAFADASVSAGATYSYAVDAFDGADNHSAASAPVSATALVVGGSASPSPSPSSTSDPSCPSGQFLGAYFANAFLGGSSAFTRCETALNHDWALGSPGAGVPSDSFSARWVGRYGFAAGDHVFAVRADDGVRLWVDGALLVDEWRIQPPTTYMATRALTAGEHEVKVEYYENTMSAVLQLSWSASASPSPSPSTSPTPSASSSPSPSPAGPCSGTTVRPGDDVGGILAGSAEGSTFCFATGTYRLPSSLGPKRGQKLIAQQGTVLSGARVLTSWVTDGSAWRTSVPIAQGSSNAVDCDSGYLCNYNEDVTYDDRFLRRVGSRGEVGPGRYFIDYSGDLVYLGDDPAGHEVEVAVATRAVSSSSTDVTIKGFIIEKFANSGQTAALSSSGTGWLIEENEIRLNHGIGVCTWAGAGMVRGNYIHDNGEMGVCGQKVGNVFEGNEISFNAPQVIGFNVFWEGGGSKFVNNTNLIVRGNHAHDNRGPGLWTDSNNVNTMYENNRVVNNTDAGILHEISCAATIRNNYASGNGFNRPGNTSYWGGGIVNWQSPDVEVYGNTVVDNKHGIMAIQTPRGSGVCGTFEVRNFFVHDNKVRQSAEGRAAGLALYNQTDSGFYTSKNNRFQANTYCLDGLSASRFYWQGGYRTWDQWRSFGLDTTGTASVLSGCPFAG